MTEHPRVRGENLWWKVIPILCPGTSPRARGKLAHNTTRRGQTGNIPACAGKTGCEFECFFERGEHPRVRGENCSRAKTSTAFRGTSPRARGKRRTWSRCVSHRRNIPACAGKTNNHTGLTSSSQEHPRVRGENSLFPVLVTSPSGTSPRARGKRGE